MELFKILFGIHLYILLAHAWPWPPSLQGLSGGLIERRQADGGNDNKSSSANAAAPSQTPSPSAKPTAAASGSSAAETGKNTNTSKGQKPTGTKSSGGGRSAATGKTSSSSKPHSTHIEGDQAGAIEMINPPRTTTTYYKIGEDVTLAWNYTLLQVTPSAINVLASNTAGTWTLTANASVQETGQVVWRTKDDEGGQNPLLTDTYTLVVYDASGSVTDTPEPGALAPFMSFQFGMYLPQQYTPLSEFICATCSGAMSEMERTTIKFVLGTVAMTILSFTWFAGDFLSFF